MPRAARLGDDHLCEIHGAGPILPDCCVTVLIGDKPAAREGDKAECPGAVDAILKGAPTVLIGDKPAARKGDPTDGGVVADGCPTAQADCLTAASQAGAPFVAGAS
jgi:uncharacterized Zn-binding protein involved in type VI secretion